MDMPEMVALFPLPNHVLLPGYPAPFRIFEPRYLDLVRDLLALPEEARYLSMPCLSPGWQADYAGAPAFQSVSALAIMRTIRSLAADQYLISVEGLVRCRLEEVPSPHAYRRARPVALDPPHCALTPERLHDVVARLCQGLRAVSQRLHLSLQQVDALLQGPADPLAMLDRLGSLLLGSPDQRQAFLECDQVDDRMALVRGVIASRVPLDGHAGLRPSEN
jgi:hypothetical protein